MSTGTVTTRKQEGVESKKFISDLLGRHGFLLLILPALLLLSSVYGVPIFRLLATSFGRDEWSLSSYKVAVTDPYMWKVLLSTLRLSAEVTALCLFLGYPVACLMIRSCPRWTQVLTVLVVLPMWTSVLVRSYAWIVVLGRNGIVNQLLIDSGLIEEPLQLLYNRFGVYVGMVHIMLPYMILPLYAAMKRVDLKLVDAARSAGAGGLAAFALVFVPLTAPGIVAGSLLVFILSLGFFVTPALLGGADDVTYVMLIERQLNESLNWELAAAMSVILLVASLILVALYWRLVGVSGQDSTIRAHVTPSWILRTATRALASWQSTFSFGSFASPLVTPALGWAVVGFLIAPIAILFPLSVSASPFLEFPPRGFSLRWFQNYFDRPDWIAATWVSIKVATLTMFAATLLGTLAAIGLVRGRFLGARLAAGFLISPSIVPALITAVAVYFQFAQFKLVGTITGLVLAHMVLALPLVVIVVSGALRSVDVRPEQAARSLGATSIIAFLKVTLPAIKPGILTAAFFAFLASFDDVVLALFLSGTSATTLPKRMWDGVRFEVDPTIAAVSTLMIMLSIALLVAPQLASFGSRRARRTEGATTTVSI
ncbi:ABC transporter permease subunit [Sinorhizobium meliloti]|uniref:Polyamine/opine ABC transporter, permease component n=1 Tax=Rhizobium meliloti TaxID=382 RepID=I2E214_RHIML|nr:ABC transporter permease subunit [Sinorhizobium meliloti]AFJ91532.1 polyamine/opine ABC transporter, permease component [Sinorhizobium meliloti]MQW41582.1 ABC transporter permease subunit [Sinorhizobium meliloti]